MTMQQTGTTPLRITGGQLLALSGSHAEVDRVAEYREAFGMPSRLHRHGLAAFTARLGTGRWRTAVQRLGRA